MGVIRQSNERQLISFKNGRVYSESQSEAINHSKYCLHLTTDNNDTGAQLFICDEHFQGDIEKQLHKSLVRVIGEASEVCVGGANDSLKHF